MSNVSIAPLAGKIVTPDGGVAFKPSVELSPEQATILRTYFQWAMRAQLEPELFCGDCFDHSRDSKALFDITDDHVLITCPCRIRYYNGPTPVKVIPGVGMSVTPVDGEPADLPLPITAALLLRKYKKVLLATGLKEALRCNACFELNLSDGCAAVVTNEWIDIQCRCTHRTYRGMTL